MRIQRRSRSPHYFLARSDISDVSGVSFFFFKKRYNAIVSKIRQVPYRGVKVEVDCTGVHCYDTETDHAGDEVILTVSAPVSLRDNKGYFSDCVSGKAVSF